VLHNLTVALWPNAARRPKLFGPDPHSLHDATGEQLDWIARWLTHCRALGVPIHGVTHHEYIEVDPTTRGFTAPTRLALNSAVAAAVNTTVRAVDANVQIWGGESACTAPKTDETSRPCLTGLSGCVRMCGRADFTRGPSARSRARRCVRSCAVGPHNGGSPPCDHSSMRWAVA
jgi:hypothetical protein